MKKIKLLILVICLVLLSTGCNDPVWFSYYPSTVVQYSGSSAKIEITANIDEKYNGSKIGFPYNACSSLYLKGNGKKKDFTDGAPSDVNIAELKKEYGSRLTFVCEETNLKGPLYFTLKVVLYNSGETVSYKTKMISFEPKKTVVNTDPSGNVIK